MGLFQSTNSAEPNLDAPLPGASTIRRFHCRSCAAEVVLCSGCDRGNIYCQPCSTRQAKERIQRARKKYRESRAGKLVRAAAEKRRRGRRKREIEDFVGDRGSLLDGQKGNAPISEPVGLETGEPSDESVDVRSDPVGPQRVPPAAQGLVRCACCMGLFVPFERQGPRRGHEARLLRARGPPANLAHGG
jgi:hypothetical protein